MKQQNNWVQQRLNRKFLLGNAAGILISSLVFLLLYLGMYQEQISDERADAAGQVNQLLQTSLENAMLKRDLEGLRHIVDQLGEQQEIVNVMILNPAGEVRFSSDPALLGRRFDRQTDVSCAGCHAADVEGKTLFLVNEQGHEVLRSVNPVRNKAACAECHGPASQKPINGVLFVDYDAAPIRDSARRTTLALVAAGVCVLTIVLTGGWWFMRRFVLTPVRQLHETSQALSQGELAARVDIAGSDELAELGDCFNGMAEAVQRGLAELESKEQFLQGLVDAVPDGLRVIDQDYRVVLVNRAYRRQHGIADDEPVTVPCYQSSHGRDTPCAPTLVTCPLHELADSAEPVKCVHTHRRRDGSELQVEIYAARMQVSEHGDSRQFVVESVRDLDSAVRFSHEQKLSELGQLAAGVAHEIYNPLTSVQMLLASLQRLQDPGDPRYEESIERLQLVGQEVDRCVDITGRLLKLSMYSGDQAQVVSVNAAVNDTLSLLRWDADAAGIELIEQLDPDEPRILAREADFRMVVLNIVQNAFHAMPDGGRLAVSTLREAGQVVVRLEDTGVGMSAEVLDRIFDPFFSRRADGVHGTGLGLAISRANVERDGGKIAAESRPGEGTVFTLRYPDPEV